MRRELAIKNLILWGFIEKADFLRDEVHKTQQQQEQQKK